MAVEVDYALATPPPEPPSESPTAPQDAGSIIDAALARLVEQFKELPVLRAVLLSVVRRVQDLEESLELLRTQRGLDIAVGAQLDGIGRIVGLRRGALTDEEYRRRLSVQIRINLADGTPDDILGTLALIVGPDVLLSLTEGPAEIRVTASPELPAGVGELVNQVLQTIRPAGVRAVAEWADVDSTPVFCFAGATGGGFSQGHLARVRAA